MASWSSRRKLGFAIIFILIPLIIIVGAGFALFYKTPTCSDNKKNGDELGVDCGGSCSRLCQSAFQPPYITWGGAKFEKLAQGLYNVSAYIENPNVNGAANDVPYKITLYDERGILITEALGKVTLYAHRNSLAFQSAVNVQKRIPARATFEFTQAPVWFKSHDELEGISITDKKYQEDGVSNSSLEVTLENHSLKTFKNIQVSVALKDIDGNVIGFSQTSVDAIAAKDGKEIAPFTWPISRNNKVNSIEVILSTIPVLDN